ncbi:MAG: hypothetical protein EBX40_08175 [Gammaproteobacteria bacterium]|nr:hypothetical protein [Gammaproteobacteria bacterium]
MSERIPFPKGDNMPFKSEAQRRKFGSMIKKGEISQKTFDEWNAETPKNIPERKSKPKTLNDLKKIAKAKMKK